MEEHRVDSDRRDESDFNDDLYLASLGYTNEFKRDMTLWGEGIWLHDPKTVVRLVS